MATAIREAALSDIPAIRAVAGVAFPATYKDIITQEQCDYMMDMMYSPESLRRQMSSDHHTYFIYSIDGRDVGYVSVQPQGDGVFELQKIYVLPELQGKHIGRQLFKKAVEWVRATGEVPCRIELHVNRHNRALGFYEHEGMKKLREGDFPIGRGFFMNDYIMGLDVE